MASGRLDESSPQFAVSANRQQKDSFIVPSRPTVSDPADIQRVGVLQLEFGVDAEFDAKEFRNQQTTPLDLRFAALSRLLLDFQLDAYHSKLPNASKEKMLGSGRVDHEALLLISEQLGGINLNVNAAYLNVGRKDSGRRADGGLLSIALSHRFENHFGVFGELSGQSLELSLPRGVYPLGGVTYRVNPRLRFDAGLRFGIGAQAPRVSVVAGFVFGIADLY